MSRHAASTRIPRPDNSCDKASKLRPYCSGHFTQNAKNSPFPEADSPAYHNPGRSEIVHFTASQLPIWGLSAPSTSNPHQPARADQSIIAPAGENSGGSNGRQLPLQLPAAALVRASADLLHFFSIERLKEEVCKRHYPRRLGFRVAWKVRHADFSGVALSTST